MASDDHRRSVYDDPEFFGGYTRLERFRSAFGAGMEHGALLDLVGNEADQRVLDLGCGGGQLAVYLADAGAREVVGIDSSERMLEVARTRNAHPRVNYRSEAMEDADFPAESFDLLVSSLALHYVRDYAELVARVAKWLVPGGRFVYSTEHPVYTCRISDHGWITDSNGQRLAWGIDRYTEEGPREHHWFVPGVRRYHRTVATHLNGLVDAGLAIQRVIEPSPSEAWLQAHPADADERRRPLFLLVSTRKT